MTRAWLALGVLAVAVLLIGVDGTVLALAMPFIATDLKTAATQVLWIGDIYSFVLAGLLVTMGGLGDRIGHKKLLLAGATAFAAASVAAAYAPNAALLIGARALLGAAGATLAPSTLALIRSLFPQSRERSVAVGIWASAFSAGAILGPMLGGLLLEHFWWGSVFLINLPVAAVLFVGGVALLPEQRNPLPGPWDPPSVGLSLLGMLGVVYAVQDGVANGFHIDALILGVGGAAALALFVRRQLSVATPLIEVRLFGNHRFSAVVVANLLAVLGLSGVVYFLSQFFQLVMGYSPLQAGLAELPAAVGATAFGVLAGVAMRHSSQRAILTIGLALVGSAMASLSLIGPHTEYPHVGVSLFVLGIGLGLAYTAASDVILASVPPERAGAAAAVSETGYELGTALGIATLGSIVTGVFRALMVSSGTADSLPDAIEAAKRLPDQRGLEVLAVAKSAFSSALAVAAGIGSVLVLASAAAIWVLLKPAPAPPEPRAGSRTGRAPGNRCRPRKDELCRSRNRLTRPTPNIAACQVSTTPPSARATSNAR
ncbi:MFS transporter [Mycobacterium terramassiliense]|uniref:Predicted arabinose efflux permease, MFS family n=1 Tax=Mycobacterium terramassiliense TaxID=1841859 RepID=A0A2U3NIW9_9MYCO|nr:MFS transporter [Mycobacterium terramassiliense]SPM31468.1 Predicted arabinose efflux permease, MFS family [Mycobacterium terramassiliense]